MNFGRKIDCRHTGWRWRWRGRGDFRTAAGRTELQKRPSMSVSTESLSPWTARIMVFCSHTKWQAPLDRLRAVDWLDIVRALQSAAGCRCKHAVQGNGPFAATYLFWCVTESSRNITCASLQKKNMQMYLWYLKDALAVRLIQLYMSVYLNKHWTDIMLLEIIGVCKFGIGYCTLLPQYSSSVFLFYFTLSELDAQIILQGKSAAEGCFRQSASVLKEPARDIETDTN